MYYDRYFSLYRNGMNPFMYENEWMQENEYERMKSYYPETARHIQEKVEIECDKMDYEGSRMYDEYPDKYMLYQTCKRIRKQIENDEYGKIEMQECRGKGPCRPERPERPERPGRPEKPEESGFIDDLIQILLYQEISRRRCRRQRCRCFY